MAAPHAAKPSDMMEVAALHVVPNLYKAIETCPFHFDQYTAWDCCLDLRIELLVCRDTLARLCAPT